MPQREPSQRMPHSTDHTINQPPPPHSQAPERCREALYATHVLPRRVPTPPSQVQRDSLPLLARRRRPSLRGRIAGAAALPSSCVGTRKEAVDDALEPPARRDAAERRLQPHRCARAEPARRQRERELERAGGIPRRIGAAAVGAEELHRAPEAVVLSDSGRGAVDGEVKPAGVRLRWRCDGDGREATREPHVLLPAEAQAEEEAVEVAVVAAGERRHVEPAAAPRYGHLLARQQRLHATAP